MASTTVNISWNAKFLRFTLKKDLKFVSLSQITFEVIQSLIKLDKDMKVISYQGSSSIMYLKENEEVSLVYKNMKINNLKLTLSELDVEAISNFNIKDGLTTSSTNIVDLSATSSTPIDHSYFPSTSKLSTRKRELTDSKKNNNDKKRVKKNIDLDIFQIDTQDLLFNDCSQRM